MNLSLRLEFGPMRKKAEIGEMRGMDEMTGGGCNDESMVDAYSYRTFKPSF